MNSAKHVPIHATSYDRHACQVGVVHLGFGAFHRAHQAVYLDDYMEATGDLRWGIAAVNLRGSEAAHFQEACDDIARHDGYFLKSYSADGHVALRRVRAHVQFADWSADQDASERLLAQSSVHLVTITVTESGYYTDPNGDLNLKDATIAAEIAGTTADTVYAYLQACGDTDLTAWVEDNVSFPCSMVDRITPRSPAELGHELSALIGQTVTSPIMAEDFTQWVLQSKASADMPDLAKAGVTVTRDVDPYEETKIRVLNGGHTAVCYLAALDGVATFDAAMRLPHLNAHFHGFETQEVLPALTLDLPFSKEAYVADIARRFGNKAIGDTVARICADGMAKFPIFIRPTLEGCLKQGITPVFALRSIASWYVFARHVQAGKIPFKYIEPSWDDLQAMLGTDSFLTSRQLWGDLPETYPSFSQTLRREITEMETQWPV